MCIRDRANILPCAACLPPFQSFQKVLEKGPRCLLYTSSAGGREGDYPVFLRFRAPARKSGGLSSDVHQSGHARGHSRQSRPLAPVFGQDVYKRQVRYLGTRNDCTRVRARLAVRVQRVLPNQAGRTDHALNVEEYQRLVRLGADALVYRVAAVVGDACLLYTSAGRCRAGSPRRQGLRPRTGWHV